MTPFKMISPRLHGAVDYAACGAMLLLPGALKLSPRARLASRAFALGYLGLSALTDYPYALKRVVPFPLHGRAELLSAPALLLTPALLGAGAGTRERGYFQALTVMVLGAYLSTDWQAPPER